MRKIIKVTLVVLLFTVSFNLVCKASQIELGYCQEDGPTGNDPREGEPGVQTQSIVIIWPTRL